VSRSLRDQLVIVAVGCVVLFTRLGTTGLWDLDEALWGSTAVEMGRRGDWITPWQNGEVSTHKPPLMFWVMLVGTRICGQTEFGFRIGSALFGLATALVVQRLGATLACRRVGLLAGVATVTALNFAVVARGATPDVMLTFFTTLALLIFVRHAAPQGWPPPGPIAPLPLRAAVSLYAVLGLAVLTKGPLGVALPVAALGLFAWWYTLAADPAARGLGSVGRAWIRAAAALRPVLGFVVVVAVAGPWYVAVQRASGGAFGADFIGVHHIKRFLEPIEGHSGPLFYYVPAFLIGMFPWSMFAIPTALDAAARVRAPGPARAGAMLLVIWLATWIGVFSIAQTKLPNYILPAYPAASLLVATFLVGWLTQPVPSSRRWMQVALVLLIGIGGATAAGCLAVPHLRFGARGLLEAATAAPELAGVLRLAAWTGGIMALGGVACLALVASDRRRGALVAYVGMAATVVLFILGVVAVEADRHQPARTILAIMRDHGATAATPLGQCRYSQPSLVHYADRRVEPCREAGGCADFFRRFPDGMLVIRAGDEAEARALMPAGSEVIGQCPSFPKAGRILVVRRPPATAAIPAASPR
jgi:4-amino-4-deoxy-L-arabinose transferase-like glycosyltransferase